MPFNKKFSKKGGHKKSSSSEFIVPKWKFFGKYALSAYPDETGSPLYIGDADSEAAFLGKGKIVATRSNENTEMMNRIGFAISMGASSFEAGIEAIDKYVPDVLGDADVEKLQKCGLASVKEILGTEDGKAFVKAAGTLNIGTKKKPTEDAVKEAIAAYVNFLKDENGQKRKALSRVAGFSARLYLMSMTMLEHLDLHEHKKKWCKGLSGKLSASARAWKAEPADADKMSAALVAAFLNKVQQNKAPKKKRNLSDDEDAGAAVATSSSADEEKSQSSADPGDSTSSSSSEKKQKKKKKQAKKKKAQKSRQDQKKSEKKAKKKAKKSDTESS